MLSVNNPSLLENCETLDPENAMPEAAPVLRKAELGIIYTNLPTASRMVNSPGMACSMWCSQAARPAMMIAGRDANNGR